MRLQGTMKINQAGHLEIGGCDTVMLAQEFGTPLWVMDEEELRRQCRIFKNAFTDKYDGQVAYASKAFLTLAVAAIIKEEGLSLDVVSGGELYTALQAGFPAERIFFHGNNKSLEELKLAVDSGVGRIVVDNSFELTNLEGLVREMGVAPVAIMLRLAPGVEAHTHEYCQTGQEDSKFGFDLRSGQAMEAAKQVISSDCLVLKGVHCHIGSQIFEEESFIVAAEIMMQLMADIYRETGFVVEELNLGGGFGIYYSQGDAPKSVAVYADKIYAAVAAYAENLGIKMPQIVVEPGRAIVGTAGTTLYTLGASKEIPGIRKYVSVDGGMSDNIRPALYGALFEAALANRASEIPSEMVSVAGKCCESGDMLIWDILLPPVEPGDILAMSATGAYCYTMSSNYNRLPRPAVVLVREGKAEVIVKRESYSDLLRNDVLLPRLKDTKE